MEGFDAVRALARVRHREACARAGGGITAAALLDAATALTGIERQGVAAMDPILHGAEAVLVPDVPAIFYKSTVAAELAAFYQAHEFAHHWLDSAAGACSSAEIDAAMPEERMPLGLQRVEGYGPRERRECQANVFAREFLLPSDVARRLFGDERLSAEMIAARRGLPLGLVHQQLAHGLLVPEIEPTSKSTGTMPPLDDSQRAAAEVEHGPLLIEAGPGTGKTRTLIARIVWLRGNGVDPASILALTFSNKAAEEMRERVALAAPDAAAAIWAGTFHAFGLEILRKFGHLIELPAEVRLVDPSDALLLLEAELPSLPLNHYLQLYEPAFALRDILAAISRAKDELVTPAQYLAYGEAMLRAAADDDAREAAERAIEVAQIYAAYEELLRRNGIVDFADLIVKAIAVLNDHAVAREAIRARYQHVLVDEYQDVNRASGVLLKLIAGDGANLWVVGDARQSIYRFRGASPVNIRAFETDFPGAKRLALSTNYRSQAAIVRLVEAFAPAMRASVGGLPARWLAHRGDRGGRVMMEVAVDLAAEAEGLAREVQQQRARGISYRDQAILCRSHTNLARFAKLLEAQGVPVLYLGDLFERKEIRDLLSLLSLTCEHERGGLLRVAAFPEYAVPLADVRAVLAFAHDHGINPMAALHRLPAIAGLTTEGRERLTRLAAHLDGTDIKTTPAGLLTTYLFTRSRYLDGVLAADGIVGQQRRLAIFQFLQFAFEQERAGAGDPKRHLLQWVRRLETFGDERQLRQLPAAANGIDAVRLLTVHASKGLEFGAVYLPALGATMFPVSPHYNPCPAPAGMLPEDPKDTHAEEEECLFFVGLSRARDMLCLSRAERYGMPRKPSSLLLALSPHLPRSPGSPPTWRSSGPETLPPTALPHLAPDLAVHAAEDLDQYIRCPRSYLYQRILGLSGARDDNAYVRFHRCVYAVLRWMGGLPAGTAVVLADAIAKLEEAWAVIGPADHPYAPVYWRAATAIVERAVTRRTTAVAPVEAVWDIRRGGGIIRVKPDLIEIQGGHVLVRRLRTGRPPQKIDDDLYALYHLGAQQAYPTAQRHVEALFLTSDEARPVPMTDKVIGNRLDKYDQAIAGIRAGDFPPRANDRTCPRCPQYFICPGLPAPANAPVSPA